MTGIPGYDREAITAEDWQEYRQEAERRGHIYQLFVDGYDHPNPEEGILFRAPYEDSDESAKRDAYKRAWDISAHLDRNPSIEPHYPTHGYKLYHQGKLIADYTPPNPEDVKSGKVVLPDARDRWRR
jgi:hypothetical protein